MSISEYFEWFILCIPYKVYGWGVFAFLLVLVLMMLWKGIGRGIRYATAFLLAEFTALLLYFTVFLHRAERGGQMVLTPFWRYRSIHQGTKILIQEHVMNIAVFIPIGIMLGIIMREVVWWKVILVGMGISMSIELLQLILMRGCCETDDVIHNTLGCLVGYGIVRVLRNENGNDNVNENEYTKNDNEIYGK